MPSPQSTPTEHPTLTFDNEVAIVTGAGSGIGRACAAALATDGAAVTICGRTESKLEDAAKKIEAAKLLNDADKIKEDLAAFAAAELDTGFIGRHADALLPAPAPLPDAFWALAARAWLLTRGFRRWADLATAIVMLTVALILLLG